MYPDITSPEEQNFNGNGYPAIEDDGIGFEDGEYTGLDDDHVDFGGKRSSFATELRDHKTFTVTVNNANNVNQRVAFGAPIEVSAGTALLVEGVVVPGVTCNGSPKSYDSFRRFIERHPTRLIAVKMQSNNTAQLAQTFVTSHFSPYENLGSKPMTIASFTKEESLNANMVTLKNLNYQLDDQTEIAIDVPANTQTVFTLYMGGAFNTARALNNKANRASGSSRVQASKG